MSRITVGVLKKILETVPNEFLVILSSDSEGNSYSPAWSAWIGSYIPITDYRGEILDEKDETEANRNAIFLWPSN